MVPNDDKLVIPKKRLPTQPRGAIYLAAILWLYLDRYHAPIWLVGVLTALFLIALVAILVRKVQQQEREVLFRSADRDNSGGLDRSPSQGIPPTGLFPRRWKRGKIVT